MVAAAVGRGQRPPWETYGGRFLVIEGCWQVATFVEAHEVHLDVNCSTLVAGFDSEVGATVGQRVGVRVVDESEARTLRVWGRHELACQ